MSLFRDLSTQAEIDQAYNPRWQVDDVQRHLDWYSDESARARHELTCHLDAPFGPTPAEIVDIFPAAKPGAPVLVFIHGGYWRAFTSKEFSFVARGPVAHGMTVVVTNYALCPEVTLDEITRQSRAALAWLWHNVERFNGDRDQINVVGHSAGGQQVGMLAATDWAGGYGLPADLIKAGIPISGLFDLRPFVHSWLQPSLQLDAGIIQRQSPLFNLPESGPRLWVTVGGLESAEFRRQSEEFAAAWQAQGLHGEQQVLEGKNHFDLINGLADAESDFCQSVVDFVARCG
ncbi:MAG: alpha/beta hydrolase [Caldilineaceae bacterium]|nr:alpha/beta hydrolase [Caldilineaceae bacterium]